MAEQSLPVSLAGTRLVNCSRKQTSCRWKSLNSRGIANKQTTKNPNNQTRCRWKSLNLRRREKEKKRLNSRNCKQAKNKQTRCRWKRLSSRRRNCEGGSFHQPTGSWSNAQRALCHLLILSPGIDKRVASYMLIHTFVLKLTFFKSVGGPSFPIHSTGSWYYDTRREQGFFAIFTSSRILIENPHSPSASLQENSRTHGHVGDGGGGIIY